MRRFVLIALAACLFGALAIPSLAQTNQMCVLRCLDHGHLDSYCEARCTNGGVPLTKPQTPVPAGQPAPQSPAGQTPPQVPAGQTPPPAGQTTSPKAPAHSVFDIFKGTAPAAHSTPPDPPVDNLCVLRCLDRHLDQYCQRVCAKPPVQAPAPASAK